jgi:hypothetical protein
MAEFDSTDLDVIGKGMEILSVAAQSADVDMKGVNPSNVDYTTETAVEVDSLRSGFVERVADANFDLEATQTFNA